MRQAEIAERCGCEISLVYMVSKQYVEGLERVLNRKKRETGPVPRKVTGGIEAKIIALSRGAPPPGYAGLRLREERSKIELGIQLSDATIGNVLRNTALKPRQKKCRRIPPKQNAAAPARLAMWRRRETFRKRSRVSTPYDANKPVIRVDGQPARLLGEARKPIPMNENHCEREDNEYVRKGTCSIFMFTEPLGGRRFASASPRRTKQDWAREFKAIANEYAGAEKIVLVMDNLHTHNTSS
jgi:hypothetical protein